MTDKILSLFDAEWFHFGIAKSIQDIHDCNLFGIIDIETSMKTFFETQNIVKLEKQWFHRDFLPQKKKSLYDIDFLKTFEKNYNLNIWNIAFSERLFLNFNIYYKFSYDEILSILYNECKIFDSILNEVNPDFLLIKFTDTHQSHLLHQMCKAKQIKTLMLGPTRFGGRFVIYDEYEIIDDLEQKNVSAIKQRTELELKEYLENYDTLKTLKPYVDVTKQSFVTKTRKYLHNLSLLSDPTVTDYYSYYGKTKLKIIKQFVFFKKWYRKNFIEKNLKKNIDNKTPFIYYPLHVEPERQLLMVTPFYTNQLEIITNIAKSLPVGFKLYVKEHGMMTVGGWRPIQYYEQIMDLPNVEIIHPDVSSKTLLESCSLVVTINGTTGLEAIFYKKPVIVFSNTSYSTISTVCKINKIEELPQKIKSLLGSKVNISELNNYIDLVERNSFEIDMSSLYLSFIKYFSKDYNPPKSSISESQMKAFIEKNSKSFNILAQEHVKQIKKYQNMN